MVAWLVRRVAASIAIVLAVVTLTFFLIHLAGGSPCGSPDGQPVPPEVCDDLRQQFGLDQPLIEQYWKYLRNLLHGELGVSFAQHRSVSAAFRDAMPNTLILAGAALLVDFAVGLALGVYQAARARRFADIALGNVGLFLNSMPTFWLGLVLMLVFALRLHWLPAGGKIDPARCPSVDTLYCLGDLLRHLVLPALALGLVGAAGTARYQRAATLEVVRQDYVRTARAKGLRERRVWLHHILRNALLPFITLVGLAFPFLLTGAVLVEWVFAWPGMGWLSVNAVRSRDYPVVTAAALVASAMVAVGNLLADVLYVVADPRIGVRGGARSVG